MNAGPILELRDVHTHFPLRDVWGRRSGWLRAVDGVSLSVARGEVVGIVGESGCGKTTIGKTIAGIHQCSEGAIQFEGHDIGGLSPREGREFRKGLQYCYQDPGASLDPHWRIGRSLSEPLVIHTELIVELRRCPGSLIDIVQKPARGVIRQRKICWTHQRNRNRIQTGRVKCRWTRNAVGLPLRSQKRLTVCI